MHKHEHKKIIEAIQRIDTLPEGSEAFTKWVKANQHIKFLGQNAQQDEFVLYASGPYTYVNTVLIPRTKVEPPNIKDLLRWNGCNPYTVRSGYVSGGGQPGTWIEHGLWSTGTRSLEGAQLLVYARTFEGWNGSDNTYFEALQEFIHLQSLYWISEQSAYCRLDSNGDLEAVMSITKRSRGSDVTLVSVARDTLDEYLSVANLSAVRVFDFTLLRRENFPGWGDHDEEVLGDCLGMWYRQGLITGVAGYTRGIQIIQPRDNYAPRQPSYLRKLEPKDDYVKFTIQDWRNECLIDITTNPNETTNYFEANGNNLPFDVSPAFFRPEVLSKYKADKDKYIIETRRLSCRGSWELQTYDVNEAGQVHTYICYLRHLPISEQLHWAQFNEPPKAPISKRAFSTDIKGEFTDIIDPLDKLRSLLIEWHERDVVWWKMPDDEAMQRICTPITSSRDEWAEAFLDLNKLVNEGFVLKAIRAELNRCGVEFDKNERSLKLLERLWAADDPAGHGVFISLKTIAHIRSKTKGHAGTADARALANEAIREHGSFHTHFDTICIDTIKELKLIEGLF